MHGQLQKQIHGETFASSDGKDWVDLNTVSITGIDNISGCIKVFTTTKAEIVEPITLSSSIYTIQESEDFIIKKISPNTALSKLKSNLQTNGSIKVLDNDGKEVDSNSIIKTGMTLKLVGTNNEYSMVVTGDVNGDGKITATDLLKLKKNVVNLEKLVGVYALAGDINFSGGITGTDILKLKQAICNIIEL